MKVHEFHAALSIRPTSGDLDHLTKFLHAKITDTGTHETVQTKDGPIQVPVFDGADCHTVEYKTVTAADGSVVLVLNVAWEKDPDEQAQAQVVKGIKRLLDPGASVGHMPPPPEDKPATDEELSGSSTRG